MRKMYVMSGSCTCYPRVLFSNTDPDRFGLGQSRDGALILVIILALVLLDVNLIPKLIIDAWSCYSLVWRW